MSICLPVEIVDIIVETIIRIHPQPDILNALALVAHAFRHTVNATRFRCLDLFLGIATARTRLLADLLSSESTVWPEHEKAAQHIRILYLTFSPYTSRDPDTSSRDLIDESFEVSIVTILDSILHVHPPNRKGLHISIWPGERSVDSGFIRYQYSLATLGPETRLALLNLCSSTNIDTLELDNLSDVPSALVLSTDATTLNISSVRFASYTPPLPDFPFKNVRRLSVGSSLSFSDILCELHGSPLPALERLKVGLSGRYVREADLKAWSRFTTNTTELHIEVIETVTSSSARRQYTPRPRPRTQQVYFDIPSSTFYGTASTALHKLQHLHLFGSIHVIDGFPDSPEDPLAIQEPVFANIISLLPLVFPPLVDIHVLFRAPYSGPIDPPSAAHYALDQVYFGLHHPALVKLLANAAHASPAARVSAMLELQFTHFTPYSDLPGFDNHSVERGYEAYLYDKFRTLRDLHAVPLHIRVDIP